MKTAGVRVEDILRQAAEVAWPHRLAEHVAGTNRYTGKAAEAWRRITLGRDNNMLPLHRPTVHINHRIGLFCVDGSTGVERKSMDSEQWVQHVTPRQR